VSGLLDMQVFFPYRLAVLADAVSRSVACSSMATGSACRGMNGGCWRRWRHLTAATATEVADYSTLDKMQVSRAMAANLKRGAASCGREGRADRRTKTLTLTAAGRALFRRIVPLVKEREQTLLAALTPEERQALAGIMDKLLSRARAG
jgi:DNA-binding MarR family transcriptional regulator